MIQLSKTLKSIRKATGNTQTMLAALSGIDPCTISLLESGRVRDPYWTTLEALVEACGWEIVFRPKEKKAVNCTGEM